MEGTLTTNSKKVKAFITHFLHYEDLCSINYSKKKTMTTGFNRSNQMLTQTSNKEKKQKQRSIGSPWVENP